MKNADWLKEVSILKGVPGDGLKTISGLLEPRKYGSGEAVYGENENGGSLYIVKSGKLRVYRTPKAENMSVVELATLKKNDIFGEMSFLEEHLHTANISAVEDSEIYVLEREKFEGLVETDPRLAYLITRNLLLVIESIIRKMNADYVSMMEYMYIFGK
ncbi:MAG: cyclic nucleotide-binding domain-containing protein [Thermodesulfobacteriota bacterium]